MEISEIKHKLLNQQERVTKLKGIFEIDNLFREISELEQLLSSGSIWDNPSRAGRLNQDLQTKKSLYSKWNELSKQISEYIEILDLAEEDIDIQKELEEGLENIEIELRSLELKQMLNGPYDKYSAILTITAGAGGTDAQDWAGMLYRMYSRWLDKKRYKYKVIDLQDGEEAGIKSVTLVVEGDYMYGYLKAEIGIHRLVRISPFDSNARRHTSFAAVNVIPDFGDSADIDINETELRIDTFRAGGAGGQHVNTTDSAVRITHIPSGIVVQCQNERSQHKNKEMAMKVLKSRLFELEEKKRKEKEDSLQNKSKIEWGSQIRSYVLHPYKMVKDHRTNYEQGNVDKVLDGDLDAFIEAFLLGA